MLGSILLIRPLLLLFAKFLYILLPEEGFIVIYNDRALFVATI